MNAQEVLLEWLDTLAARLQEEIEDTADPALAWRPDTEANNIALTIWHISRSWDILTTRVLQAAPVEQEIWHQAGWRQKTGYDPRGKGWDGVGNLAGYTQAEVAEVPAQTKDELLTYLQQAHVAFRSAISNVTSEALVEIVEDQSRYDWISNFIRDGYEHLGEIKAIKAMWNRRN
jgi:DinB superfamily